MLIKKLSHFFYSNALGGQVIYLFLYISIIWIFNLITISLASFIHILLNHSLSTIADWVVFRGWFIIILVKCTTLFIFYQFLKVKRDKLLKLRIFLKNYHQNIRYEVLVVIVFAYFVSLLGNNIQYNKDFIFDIWRGGIALLGILIFFLSDLLFSFSLDLNFDLTEKEQRIKSILFPILLFFSARLSFPYSVNTQMFGFYVLIFYLAHWKRRNWTYPLYFIICFILPFYLGFGADPIWGKSHSLFYLSNANSKLQIFGMVTVIILYLEYHKRFFVEYIYRD